MEAADSEISRIKEVLRNNPRGMNIKEISAAVAMSRNSIAKYLDVLTAGGQLEVRYVGNAKLFYLAKRVPFESMMSVSHEMIAVVDKDLRIAQVNSPFIEFIGAPRERVIGARLFDLASALLPVEQMMGWLQQENAGKESRREIHIKKNDKEMYFNALCIPTLFEDGDAGVALMFENISDQKLAELSHEESQRLLEAVLYASPVPMYVIGKDHHILAWNRAMEKFSGLKAAGMMGTRRQWQAFYPEECPCLSDLVIDGLTDRILIRYPDTGAQPLSHDGTYMAEEVLPAPGGKRRRLRFTVTSVLDNSGELIAAVETIEEIF
ncbi:MAG: PAS domain-containing protein [Methanoregula sp.]|nr:PAS domain-containing protein [Methanoregula sp.]